MKGGFNGLDIWFCITDKDGNFELLIFGSRINTEYNEITLFNIWTGELFLLDRNEKKVH